MPILVKRLSALKVKKIEQAGWYPDGAGLYLQVSPTVTKSWVYRYSIGGRGRRHGLGSTSERSSEQARNAAQGCTQMRREGLESRLGNADPLHLVQPTGDGFSLLCQLEREMRRWCR